MQAFGSIAWAFFSSPEMAPVGQAFLQRRHPTQASGSMANAMRFLQTRAGQRFSKTWASYSDRK